VISRTTNTVYDKSCRTISPDRHGQPQYSTPKARLQRSLLHEALWENTAYDGGPYGTHSWSHSFKKRNALYEYTKGLYNPTYRLVEFWAVHIWGGALDDKAGDGHKIQSAIPIVTPRTNKPLRACISKLWKDSNFDSKKTVAGRNGALYGDCPLMLDIDYNREIVRIVPANPKDFVDVRFDEYGNVTEYLFEQVRRDPLQPLGDLVTRFVVYREHAKLTSAGAEFATFLNGKPFNWRGLDRDQKEHPSDWSLPGWPMLPVVWIKHIDIGQETGVAEIHGGLEKFMAIDDTGSKFNDHVRQAVKPRWLLAGVSQRDLNDAKTVRKKASIDLPEPGRDEDATICASKPDAKAHSLTTSLDLQGASVTITTFLSEIERDYVELRYDRLRSTVESSAKALRELRKPVITKVNERRKAYDPALTTIMRFAIAVGGELRFKGYEGFALSDFDGPDTEFSIPPRAVFEVEPIDRIDDETEAAGMVNMWVQAGVPLINALERASWQPEEIASVQTEVERLAAQAAKHQQDLANANRAEPGNDPGPARNTGSKPTAKPKPKQARAPRK
jgi:hypothetical protein